MKVCVCVYVWTYTTYNAKIWCGFLISPRLGTKPGSNPNIGPWPAYSPPWPRPLLLLSSLDQSAWDYFTIVL